MSEKTFETDVLVALEQHFVIAHRVRGQHFSGKRLVIDAIVVPRKKQCWKNQEIALGIEFKDVVRLQGDTRNFTTWLSQCADYSNTNWDGYGYLFVFACPSLVDDIPAGVSRDDVTRVLNAVMGQFGIGELRHTQHYGWSFMLHGHHRIWSQANGVEEGRRYWLKRTFGHKS